jgi:hypothetical protein
MDVVQFNDSRRVERAEKIKGRGEERKGEAEYIIPLLCLTLLILSYSFHFIFTLYRKIRPRHTGYGGTFRLNH